MTLAMLYRDVEGPLRTWLRSQTDLTDVVGQHVYFAAPPDVQDKTDSWLTLRRIGGAPPAGQTPLDNALFTFGCYGRTRLLAGQLAEILVSLLLTAIYPADMDTVEALNSQIVLWAFNADDDGVSPAIPRVVVDVAMLFRAVP